MDLKQVLVEKFGLSEFRPGQQEVIEAILKGQDTLALMPTGSGKSLCFQLPALLLEGLTIIVSPLIALMKDQVDALVAKNIPATFLNSSLNEGEYRQRVDEIKNGKYKMLYVAPERFGNEGFRELVRGLKVSFLVIDEAHCISQWGHDFRPDYRRLKQARELMGMPPVLGATATATPEVKRDIVKQLEMKDPLIKVTGFDRPNLTLIGDSFFDEDSKSSAFYAEIAKVLQSNPKTPVPMIIYCGTRNMCETLSQDLNSVASKRFGIPKLSLPYHADLTKSERDQVQEFFINDKVPWIIATIAFGMGIDKSNIRYVFHYTIPASVEAYYQEVGRAGRDGKPSVCKLFYCEKDISLRHFFIETSHPPRYVFEQTYKTLHRMVTPGVVKKITYEEISRVVSKQSIVRGQVKTCLTLLKHAGAFIAPRRGQVVLPVEPVAFDSFKINYQDIEARKEREVARLEEMKSLVAANDKKKFILRYFGEV